MPRVHINLHDIAEIEELEDQADWENLVGGSAEHTRQNSRPAADSRGRGERRFGGADALDRKRAERRKSISRPIKRI